MIRKFSSSDMNSVLDIWLSASVKAHDFIGSSFWESQLDSMREVYIPGAKVYVYEEGSKILGFYALSGERLAAIFVAPESQGNGIGKSLVAHAKSLRKKMSLSVYKANVASVGFYQSQGFSITGERKDESTGHQEYTMSTDT